MIRAAGVLFYCTTSGRLLLGKSATGHTWAPFGGKADEGESFVDAARREVGEETGFYGDYDLTPIFQNKMPHARHDTYLAKLDYEFQCNTNFETSEWGWFDMDDLPVPLHPGFRKCLQKNSKALLDLNTPLTEWEVPKAPPGSIDPARLTLKQYAAIVNEKGKSHPSSAYDVDLASLNRYGIDKEGQVIRRVKVRGLNFTIIAHRDKNSYAKMDENREYIRENGNLVFFTDEEIRALGKPEYTYTFDIMNDENQRVASFQDEWGTVLIMVAKEYRGFGFGPLLTQIGRTVYPGKTSGGFTPAGYNNFTKVHRLFVSQALKDGSYSRWVRSGEMTVAEVKNIVQSTGKMPSVPADDLSSNDPSNWVLYSEYGAFILYDKKLADDVEDDSIFADKLIKGMIYVREYSSYGLIDGGALNKKLLSFLIKCGISYCREHGLTPLVDREMDMSGLDPDIRFSEASVESGMWRVELEWDGNIKYHGLVASEKQWRRSFDQYDEFKNLMMDRGDSQWRT